MISVFTCYSRVARFIAGCSQPGRNANVLLPIRHGSASARGRVIHRRGTLFSAVFLRGADGGGRGSCQHIGRRHARGQSILRAILTIQ